jgi:hypothetical protein
MQTCMMDKAQYLKDIEDNIQLDSSLTSNIVIYEANICITTQILNDDLCSSGWQGNALCSTL